MTSREKAMLFSPSVVCLGPLLAWAVFDKALDWIRRR